MKNLFEFFQKNKQIQPSKSTAKERLQLVLVHDRAGVSPTLLQTLKEEIMQVISRHIEIDAGEFEIQLINTKSEDGLRTVPALVANIPFNRAKSAGV